MTRLDVRFAQDATVDQVNNALGSIGAGIVSMSQGFTSMTIGVPRQPSVDALQALVDQLNASPGVSRAKIADVINNEAIFIPADFDLPSMALQSAVHLLPGRFPGSVERGQHRATGRSRHRRQRHLPHKSGPGVCDRRI